MKVLGYCRVSTDEQARSGLGMEDQEAKIRAYCEMKGLWLTEMLFDNGISGGKSLATRPEGKRMCRLIDEGEAEAVVILKLDRCFRNATDCLVTMDGWEKKGVALHIIDLGGNAIDTSTSSGRFMLVVLAGAAEMERTQAKERTRAALARKRRRGERLGAVPFGEGGKVEARHLKLMQAMRADGMNHNRIAKELNDRDIRTKHGKKWWAKTVQLILERATA